MSDFYTVFIIIGYEERNDRGELSNATEYQVIANSYDEALKKVKKLKKAKFYFLKSVIENFKPIK